jgi:hypothetical protein
MDEQYVTGGPVATGIARAEYEGQGEGQGQAVNPAAVLDARIRQIVAEELRSDLSPAMMMARQVVEAHQAEVAEFVDAKVAELVAYVSEQLTFMGGMVAGAKVSQTNPTGMELPDKEFHNSTWLMSQQLNDEEAQQLAQFLQLVRVSEVKNVRDLPTDQAPKVKPKKS